MHYFRKNVFYLIILANIFPFNWLLHSFIHLNTPISAVLCGHVAIVPYFLLNIITFSQYLAHTNNLFVQLQILPFKKLVIHRIGLQMFKINLGYIPKAVESLFTTNSDTHKYNTRNRDKMRSAYGKHEFMYSNFRFVGIHIWNYILDHLDINVTLPRFKKTFKTHILADNFTYHIL